MIPFVDIIGYTAALFGTFLLVPQLIKTVHTKRVEDLSLFMLVVYIISCSVWAVYGVLLQSLPIILSNSVALCIGAVQIAFLFRYRK